MRDSVPSASYSSVCNVLRQWNISLIPTYRVYRLYDIAIMIFYTTVGTTTYEQQTHIIFSYVQSPLSEFII